MPNKIPVVFPNGYHFIMKELANEFKGQFECTEKYKTFSVPIEKELKNINKDGDEDITTVSYKIKFIDSARFMISSLPNLVDNLSERIHKMKLKNCNCFFKYENVNENLMK